MTNRDYLRGLNNEKLAELLKGSKICHCIRETCNDYDDCEKCIKKWLDAKRETHVEKGQIRETDLIKWLVVIMSVNRDNCIILSETGAIRDIPTDVVDTWKIVTDETEEMFYNKVYDNLKKENSLNVHTVLLSSCMRGDRIKWQMKYLQTKRSLH